MKYLTDKDILRWNERLSNSKYRVNPRYNKRNGYPDISIVYEDLDSPTNPLFNPISNSMIGGVTEIKDVSIDYEFSFSVNKERSDEFFILLEKMFNRDLKTGFVHGDNFIAIENLKESDIVKSELEHTIYNRTFIKYTYRFKSKLTSIIAYISYLEDAINFFGKIWSYNEDGEETCLTKYRIGDIVSKQDDKSVDYLVIDYSYQRVGDNYHIHYLISEMIESDISSIIQYKSPIESKGSDISYSRNSRINDILN